MQVVCSPVMMRSSGSARDVERSVAAKVTSLVMDDLQPGTEYMCSVQAHTRKGYGAAATAHYFTRPQR